MPALRLFPICLLLALLGCVVPPAMPATPPPPTATQVPLALHAALPATATTRATVVPPPPTVPAAPVPRATLAAALPTPVPDWYRVRAGDTVANIAARYAVSVVALQALNPAGLADPLEVGRVVAVPSHITASLPVGYLAHDSEVVYGPASLGFDVRAFVADQGGFLARYQEGGRSGAELIEAVAAKYHVGPRILLATMEQLSGWVSEPEPRSPYAFGLADPARASLRAQAEWAAQQLMAGYYGQLEGRRDWVRLTVGVEARLPAGSNAGSAAVASLLAAALDVPTLLNVLQDEQFPATYQRLFGEVLGGHVRPPGNVQPPFALPWRAGEAWFFTGGPHGGYGDGESGWAALDFAPPEPSGCAPSTFPVLAIAPGLVIGSERGETWIDMDGDGDIRTGWVILYMHLATSGRVERGRMVRAGEPIGFPSCEGGHSTGTHVHIARMYHGQWMPAAGPVPFRLGGWQAEAMVGSSYDGWLRDARGRTLTACDCRDAARNQLPAPAPRPTVLPTRPLP